MFNNTQGFNPKKKEEERKDVPITTIPSFTEYDVEKCALLHMSATFITCITANHYLEQETSGNNNIASATAIQCTLNKWSNNKKMQRNFRTHAQSRKTNHPKQRALN